MQHASRHWSKQVVVLSKKECSSMSQEGPSKQLGPQWWCYRVSTSQPWGGCMAEVQMQQFNPALQLEFWMLKHAISYCNFQNKVDER